MDALPSFFYNWGLITIIALYFAVVLGIVIKRLTVPVKVIWNGVIGYIFLSIIRIIIGALLTHHTWSNSDGIEKYFTLRYSDKIYELTGEVLLQWGFSLSIGLVVGAIFFLIKKKWDMLLSKEEILLLSFGVGIIGWPNLFILVALIFVLTVIRKLIYIALRKEKASDRIVILPAIPIAIIITIFFGAQLAVWTGLYGLR